MVNPYDHRLLVVVWAVVETSLFGGVMHGWASLVYMVKEDGIYSYLCSQNISQIYSNETNLDVNRTIPLKEMVNLTLQSENSEITLPKLKSSYAEGYNTSLPADGYQSGSVKCKAQDSRIALGQTICSSTSFIGVLAFGQLHRKLGTRKVRIINWLVFVSGCLCIAFVTNDAPWLIFIAYWLVGVTGIGLLTTNIQVSYLYVSASSTVVSLICGGYDFAGSVMLFIKLAYEAGVSLKISHIVLATGSIMTAISAICWLPWGVFQKQDAVELTVEMKSLKKECSSPEDNYDKKTQEQNRSEEKTAMASLLQHSPCTAAADEVPPLKTFLLSRLFVFHTLWYIILQIRFIYFVAFLNPFLVHVTGGDTEKVSHFTNVFLYVNMFGYVTSFLTGIFYDWQKSRYNDSTPLRRSLLPAVLPLTLATLISVLLSVLILIPHLEVLYAVFILTTTYRSCLYSMAASFLSQVFPAQHFSVLYTIMVISGGLVASVQYALYSWSYAYDGAYRHVSIMLLCLVLLSFIHPVNIVIKCRQETSVPVSTDTELAQSSTN